MNILILSSGTRNKIIQYFKKEINGKGNVICADCSPLAPTLYDADKCYVVPRIDDKNYIDTVLNICKKEKVNAVLSLIDPELSLLAKNKKLFLDNGIYPIVSDYELVEKCFDKFQFYKLLKKLGIPTVLTYSNVEDFKIGLENQQISFPVFVKPRNGSCSINIQKVEDLNTLCNLYNLDSNLIIQEYMSGEEFGCDVYTDILSHEVISIFIKEKLLMRAGETDKSLSYKHNDLFSLIKSFVEKAGFIGQIDIDVFRKNNQFYVSEVNPRFGGGYPHAYECGCNFMKYIINNLSNKKNTPSIGNYEEGIYMMKYLEIMIKNVDEVSR